MARRYAYLDTSALVKFVVREPETPQLEAYAGQVDGLITSRLAALEAARAIRRVGRGTRLLQQLDDVLASFVLIDLTRDIFLGAASAGPAELRTLDAIHLATALAIEMPLEFVTYDRRLAEAASAAELIVQQPGV